jgi:hypothetical protein
LLRNESNPTSPGYATTSGYLGGGDLFDKAIADFAVAYADQTDADYQALVDAVESDRIVAETSV